MTHDNHPIHHPSNPKAGLPGTPIRTLIVDDEPLIRRGLLDRLSNIDGIKIVAECANGTEAIERLLADKIDPCPS